MNGNDQGNAASGKLPDDYDRQLGALHGLPDVVRTTAATVRHVPTLGVGGTQIYVVQTYRQRERGDMIFLDVVGQNPIRLVLPPAVANTIARQREALTKKARSRQAKVAADERKARGEQPAFLKPAAEKK